MLAPVLRWLVPICAGNIWAEDLLLKLRRHRALKSGFKDFNGLPESISDRRAEGALKVPMRVPRLPGCPIDDKPVEVVYQIQRRAFLPRRFERVSKRNCKNPISVAASGRQNEAAARRVRGSPDLREGTLAANGPSHDTPVKEKKMLKTTWKKNARVVLLGSALLIGACAGRRCPTRPRYRDSRHAGGLRHLRSHRVPEGLD